MSMRRFISLVEGKEPQILLEAKNYEEMFTAILKIDAELRAIEPNATVTNIPALVNEEIAKAKSGLKKHDRVVWYLRFARLDLCSIMVGEWSHSSDPTAAQYVATLRKILSRYEQETGKTTSSIPEKSSRIYASLTHYLSLPIPAIQAVELVRQAPAQLFQTYREIEAKWQKAQSQMFDYEDEEIVIDFGNGWFWVNLNRAACDNESRAMGHCGNAPRQGTSDRILSLRQLITKGDKKSWRPSLTFILESDGFLGEMKGRENNKPAERYHPYIVALLKLKTEEYGWYIGGIKGGGYAPERNFSVDDLSEDLAEDLFTTRPDLASGAWLYHKEGLTDRTKNALWKQTRDLTGQDFKEAWAGENLVVETWANWQSLIEDHGDSETKRWVKRSEDDEELVYYENASEHDIEHFLDHYLPVSTCVKIGQYLAQTYDLPTEENEDSDDYDAYEDVFDPSSTSDIAKAIIEQGDDLESAISSALHAGRQSGAEGALNKAFEDAISKFQNSADIDYVEFAFQNGKFQYDTPVFCQISVANLLKLFKDESALENINYSGWTEGAEINMGYLNLDDSDDEYATETFFDLAPEFDTRPKFRRDVQTMSDAKKRMEARVLSAITDSYQWGSPQRKQSLINQIDQLSGQELTGYVYKLRSKASNGRYNWKKIPDRVKAVLFDPEHMPE